MEAPYIDGAIYFRLLQYPILEFCSNVALKHPTETHFQDNYGLLESDYMCLLKNSVLVSTECSVKEL